MDKEQQPTIDFNAINIHFEIIGQHELYHITAKRAGEERVINTWLSKDKIIDFVKEHNAKGYTVWVSFNEVEKDHDSIEGISALQDLWFDIDAKREDKNKPATKEAREEAFQRASKLREYIEHKYNARGFLASSGNGMHLHFPLPRFPLVGENFRREVNAKVTAFAKMVSANAGVEIDHTYDIRRVSTVIGSLNLKIPTEPLETKWEKSLAELPFEQAVEVIQTARNANQRLLEAIMDENAGAPPTQTETSEGAAFTEKEANMLDELRAQDAKLDALLDGDVKGYKSRSEAEFALIIKLIQYGFSKKQIFYIMDSNISKQNKWKEANKEKYREHTYENAKAFVETQAQEERATTQPPAPVEFPLTENDNPLEVLIAPVRRKVLLEPAIETIILAGITAYIGKPLNLILLKKKTAEGGSYTLLHTLEIFPQEDVLFLDYVTPTAFFHEHTTGFVDKITNEDITQKIEELKAKIEALSKNDALQTERGQVEKELKRLLKNAMGIIDLRNKIIVFSEPAKSALFENLKPLLSADREVFDIIATNKNGSGRIATEHIRIIGHPVVMLVLSEDEVSRAKVGVILDPQLYSRFLKAEINTSHEKFAAGKELIAWRASGEIIEDEEYETAFNKAQQYIRWLKAQLTEMKQPGRKSNLVLNPFAKELAKKTPSEAGEDMRLFRFLIALIEARSVVYMPQRDTAVHENTGETAIVTTEEDVNSIFSKYAPQIISHLPASTLNALERLKEILKDKPLSRDEIFAIDNLGYNNSRNMYRRVLLPLTNEGYLEEIPDPSDPRHKQILYRLVTHTTEPSSTSDMKQPAQSVLAQAVAGKNTKQGETSFLSQPVSTVSPPAGSDMKQVVGGWVIHPKKCDLHNNVEQQKIKNANAKNSDFLSQPTNAHETEQQQMPETVATKPLSHPTSMHETEQQQMPETVATKNEPSHASKNHQIGNLTTEPVKEPEHKTQTDNKERVEVDRYIASASPLPQERALVDFVIILYNDGAKGYVCPRCGVHLNTIEEAMEHKQKGCVQKPEQAAHKPVTAPAPITQPEPEPAAAPQPTTLNAPTTEQISTPTPTQTTQTSTETQGAEQSAAQKEFEEKLRAKIVNGKPACADGEQMKYDVVASNHGKCTGFYAQDGALPELVKYGNKLYVFHCEDGAVAFVCSVCRTGFTTLQSFEKHAKETHGWEFG